MSNPKVDPDALARFRKAFRDIADFDNRETLAETISRRHQDDVLTIEEIDEAIDALMLARAEIQKT